MNRSVFVQACLSAIAAGCLGVAPLPAQIASNEGAGNQRQDWVRPLDQIRLVATLSEGVQPPVANPTDQPRALHQGDRAPQRWMTRVFSWQAPELWYQPLYFEEALLERHGRTLCPPVQPVISGAKFFATIPAMPCKILADDPYDRIVNLGFYRPGSWTPDVCHAGH